MSHCVFIIYLTVYLFIFFKQFLQFYDPKSFIICTPERIPDQSVVCRFPFFVYNLHKQIAL